MNIQDIELDDKEIENFFKKFNKDNLDHFDLILYFSSFNGSIKKIVTRLKSIKEKVQKDKNIKLSKSRFEQDIRLLNKKELELLIGLLDESEFCASSDERYSDETKYLDYLKTKAEIELAKNNHNRQKILAI